MKTPRARQETWAGSHICWQPATVEQLLLAHAVEYIKAFLSGEPYHVASAALGEWSDEQQTAAEADAVEQVRAAGKESEAIGTLGQSRPSVKTMFEEVYATEDWRITEQRREVGV